jgi:hypothetical protein
MLLQLCLGLEAFCGVHLLAVTLVVVMVLLLLLLLLLQALLVAGLELLFSTAVSTQ